MPVPTAPIPTYTGVARLQGDPDHARGCLGKACRCGDPALRDDAGRLRRRLARSEPRA